MSRKVLTILEPENYPEEVVARAIMLSKANDAELELLLCDPTTSFLTEVFAVSTEVQQLANNIKEAQRGVLDKFATTAHAEGIEVTASISHRRPVVDAILARALTTEPIYVVKGTHYHSPAERATFADTDWQLVKKLDYPLWFVKPVPWKDQPTIVAAVDPTHKKDEHAVLDRRIVAKAQELATLFEGRIELVHTYQRLVEIGSSAMWTFKPVKLPVDELDRKIKDEHRSKLEALAESCGVADDAVHQLPGRAHELLPTFARTHGAGLMVMGALARGGIKRRYIGNTAARVLDHLPCDVLIVPAE
jgi:universal stress protein E